MLSDKSDLDRTMTYHHHASFKGQSESQISVETRMAQDCLDSLIDIRFAGTWDIMDIHSQRMADTVRKEC